VRNVFVVGPDKKVKLILVYPMTTSRNFDAVLRVIDSLQLTADHNVATPVNWRQGDDVIIAGSENNEQAEELFGEWDAPKPYLRRRNLRLFEVSGQWVYTSAAAETAPLLGPVAIIAAPFSVMDGAVQLLVQGQARSGGSAHATENPSRSIFGSSFTRPPIWKPTTWACSSPTTSNEASLPRNGMWPTSASDWSSVSVRSHCATGTTGSFGARPGRAWTLGSTPISLTSSCAVCSARSFPLCRQRLIRTPAARAL
jgi:hypothetical protein